MSTTFHAWRGAALILLLGGSTLLAACNTVSGVGQDIESAGEAITDSAEAAK